MPETWIPALALAAGLAAGPLLALYAGWMIRGRCPGQDGKFPPEAVLAASAVNGLLWMAAILLGSSPADTVNLGITASLGVALTLIDVRIRIISNELSAALLCLAAATAVMDKGFMALPGRIGGLLAALALFLLAMRIAGPGKVGGGDVKLGAAVGFAAGFPDVLAAVLLMAVLAGIFGAAAVRSGRIGRKTPMPYAGFLTAGLVLALMLDRLGALRFLSWG